MFSYYLCFLVHIKSLYCFHYTSHNEDLPKTAGWDYFKLENEFRRMRIPNDQWTTCGLNQNYEVNLFVYCFFNLFYLNS